MTEEKFYFPYEAFTSLEFLKRKELPPHKDFFNSMTTSNITEDEYAKCVEIWEREGFETMKDHLVYYNMMDTVGMMSALQVQSSYYRGLGLCMSKDAIHFLDSLPNIFILQCLTLK